MPNRVGKSSAATRWCYRLQDVCRAVATGGHVFMFMDAQGLMLVRFLVDTSPPALPRMSKDSEVTLADGTGPSADCS